MYSLNELETLIRSSAVGAGLPLGNVEDVATAGTWLARRGFPVCDIIAAGLSENAFPPSRYVSTDWGYTFSNAQAVIAGPGAIDLLLAADQRELAIELTALDLPVLVLGLLGDAADSGKGVFGLSIETQDVITHDFEYIVGPGTQIDVKRFPSRRPSDTRLRLLSKGRSCVSREPAFRYDPSANMDNGWGRLERLARRACVRASSVSRTRGAGAGLTDND